MTDCLSSKVHVLGRHSIFLGDNLLYHILTRLIIVYYAPVMIYINHGGFYKYVNKIA